jgi:hypothetical protein
VKRGNPRGTAITQLHRQVTEALKQPAPQPMFQLNQKALS